MDNLEKILEEFEKKFITRSAFGVSIGAIDNLKESAEEQVKSFITKVYQQAYKAGKQEGREEVLQKYKEVYDNNLEL